jgi:peptide/nickel transport system ATP-binding protein
LDASRIKGVTNVVKQQEDVSSAAGAPGAAVPLLSVRHLTTEFATQRGRLRAVDDVSFDLAPGETLGIVGESGSGKSALVRSIMNLLPASASLSPETRVVVEGRDIRELSERQLRHFWGPEIAMVFQDPMTSLNPVKRIRTLLTESMRYHLGLSKKAAIARGLELLNYVGVSDPRRRLDQYPHELSGGLRQRITIAIALSCDPKLLIADEPTTALDVTVQRQILDLLSRLQRDRHMAMILISHDLAIVSGMARRVAVMYAGQFVESAPSATLFSGVQHPYTEALLASAPRIEAESGIRLRRIPGRPPDMVNIPSGCRFAPRCSYAAPECTADEIVELRSIRVEEHLVRCIKPVGGGDSPANGKEIA